MPSAGAIRAGQAFSNGFLGLLLRTERLRIKPQAFLGKLTPLSTAQADRGVDNTYATLMTATNAIGFEKLNQLPTLTALDLRGIFRFPEASILAWTFLRSSNIFSVNSFFF